MSKFCNTTGRLIKISSVSVVIIYVALSLVDLLLSQAAFALGIKEANPLLALLDSYGLFVPGKLALTAIVAYLMVILYPRDRVRPVTWSALLLMTAVDAYHVWSLRAF